MGLVKKIVVGLGLFLSIPLLYFLVSFIFSYVTVNEKMNDAEGNVTIYLTSNGNHLELIIPKIKMGSSLLGGLYHAKHEKFLSFGWGDRTYYIKTATDSDFTITNKLQAAFMNSSALLHVRRYTHKQEDWAEIRMTLSQLEVLQTYIGNTFKINDDNEKMILPGISYGSRDNFYEARGSYTCLYTCNTWINTGLKESNTKACLWTPFDFGVLRIYKK